MLPFVEAFPRNYELDFKDRRALEDPSLVTRYYPGGSTHGGGDGLWMLLTPDRGEPYKAVFSCGEGPGDALTGIYTCPDPDYLCVVVGGDGNLINVNRPQDCSEVPSIPIFHCLAVVKQGLLLFADYTDVVAVGHDGVVWRTRRIASDGMKGLAVSDDTLSGLAWSAPAEAFVPFSVELATGEVEGGLAY